jgi:hypothetical protein
MAASAPKNKYKPTAWKQTNLVDLEVPSGQMCQVRVPGVVGLVKAGILDSLDSLTGLIQTEHIDRVKNGRPTSTEITPEDLKALSADKDRLLQALDLMDRVLEYAVVQPIVLRPVARDDEGKPILMWKGKLNDDTGEQIMEELMLPDADRDPEMVYSDMVDPTDKIFIFQYVVGGVRDLETFRKEFQETLGSVESL